MSSPEAASFFLSVLSGFDESAPAVAVLPARYIQLMWGWNTVFKTKAARLAAMAYDPLFEEDADQALLRLTAAPPGKAWKRCSTGCWRVLYERHVQMLTLAMTNEIERAPALAHLPAGLSVDQQRTGLALMFLLRMKLPWAPALADEPFDLAQAPACLVRQ
jgi:hypothetical protein